MDNSTYIPLSMVYLAQSFCVVLAIPSATLYAIECAVIIRWWRKVFNNSFYKIFLVTAFNNLILNFGVYSIPICHFLELGWFVPFFNGSSVAGWAPKFFGCTFYFSFMAENFLTIIVIAQRLSAILWPLDFERAWRYLFPISMAITVFGSFALISPLFFQSFGFMADTARVPELKRLILGYLFDTRKDQYNANQTTFFVGITFFVVSTALNIAILVAYRRHKAKRGMARDEGDQKNDAIQFRLLVYSMGMFGAQTLHSGYLVFYFFYSIYPVKLRFFNRIINPNFVWINDLRCLVFPAWFLFWASSEVSSRIKIIFVKIGTKLMNGIGKGMATCGMKNKKWNKKAKQSQKRQILVTKSTISERRKTIPVVNLDG